MEQRRSLVVADAEILHQRPGHEVCERTEGDRLSRRMADGAHDPPACTFGTAEGLLGEAGLADARRTLQYDATAHTVAVVTAERLELGCPPGERPRRDHHVTSAVCRHLSIGSPMRRTVRRPNAGRVARGPVDRVQPTSAQACRDIGRTPESNGDSETGTVEDPIR
jgi:hypothetical protein